MYAIVSFVPGQELIGPVGDYLIYIHIGRSTAASLKKIDRKVLNKFSGHDFVGSLANCAGYLIT